GLEVPDARELPRVRRAVVPEVRAGRAVVRELVPERLPRLAAVVGALDQLAEPAARLRRVQAIRLCGRSLQMIHRTTAAERARHAPARESAVGLEDERAFARSDQDSYSAHHASFASVGVGPSPVLYRRTGRRQIDVARIEAVVARGIRRPPATAGLMARRF